MALKKADIIAAIQIVADASPDPNFIISFGTPGDSIENSIGETEPTGQAWEEPGAWPIAIEGIANAVDTASSPSELEIDSNYTLNGVHNLITVKLARAPSAIVITIPPASAGLSGEYIIKGKENALADISGDIDGMVRTIPLLEWDVTRLLCTGSEWLVV